MYEFNLKIVTLYNVPNMFCQSNFITNKILLIGVKKIAVTETTLI